MGIYAKLSAIQQKLIAPKNQYNDYGKYRYRSCEDILEGLKPCLKETETSVTIGDELVLIGDRYYIRATATLIDNETGESVSNIAYAREDESKKGMDASQITGATSSYARKYALNGLFCIDDVKDADLRNDSPNDDMPSENDNKTATVNQAQAEAEQKQIEKAKISDVKVKSLQARCTSDGVNPATIQKLYKVNSLADLTEKQFANIHEHWEDIKKAN